MDNFDRRFLDTHPQYTLLVDADEDTRALLLWAASNKYIVFNRTPTGCSVYSQEDLDKAKMWWEKVGGW